MLRHSLSDADRDRLTDHAKSLAEYEPGDRVTMKPFDHDVPHAGRELVGAPLVVEEVVWRDLDTTTEPEGEAARYDSVEESDYIEIDADEWATDKQVYARPSRIEYRFENERAPITGEFGLIPWAEYREEHDRVTLYPEVGERRSDHTQKWLEPFEDDECDVCGCNMARHWYWNNGVQCAGGNECAACGDVKERHAP